MSDALNIPHSSPWISEDDVSRVVATLRSGMVAEGVLVREFERRCADYLGLSYARSTGSGQAALSNALVALGARSGSQVVIPSYVCRAVEDAVKASGADPVYCDVGDDWCVNSQTVSAVISSKTAAIVAVHPFGIMADIDSLKHFGLPIVEDCCQCFSPTVGGKGDVAVYSFHATKCLATGEGGLVGTINPTVAERLAIDAEGRRDSSRLSDLQAALGISQLTRYEEMLLRRRAMASRYLAALPCYSTRRIKAVAGRSIFFRFPLSVDCGFDAVVERFNRHGVRVRRGVDALLHCVAGGADERFPKTAELFRTTVSLPFYPALDDSGVHRVLSVAAEVLG